MGNGVHRRWKRGYQALSPLELHGCAAEQAVLRRSSATNLMDCKASCVSLSMPSLIGSKNIALLRRRSRAPGGCTTGCRWALEPEVCSSGGLTAVSGPGEPHSIVGWQRLQVVDEKTVSGGDCICSLPCSCALRTTKTCPTKFAAGLQRHEHRADVVGCRRKCCLGCILATGASLPASR